MDPAWEAVASLSARFCRRRPDDEDDSDDECTGTRMVLLTNTAEKRARVALRCLGLSQHFDEAGGVCPRPFLLHTHSFIHVYDATLIGSFARSNAFKQGGSTEVMIRLCVINVITFTVQVCSGERLETYKEKKN